MPPKRKKKSKRKAPPSRITKDVLSPTERLNAPLASGLVLTGKSRSKKGPGRRSGTGRGPVGIRTGLPPVQPTLSQQTQLDELKLQLGTAKATADLVRAQAQAEASKERLDKTRREREEEQEAQFAAGFAEATKQKERKDAAMQGFQADIVKDPMSVALSTSAAGDLDSLHSGDAPSEATTAAPQVTDVGGETDPFEPPTMEGVTKLPQGTPFVGTRAQSDVSMRTAKSDVSMASAYTEYPANTREELGVLVANTRRDSLDVTKSYKRNRMTIKQRFIGGRSGARKIRPVHQNFMTPSRDFNARRNTQVSTSTDSSL